jgi:biopolymer transport protein TolR
MVTSTPPGSGRQFAKRGESPYGRRLMAEINVTPFVDVMLVLLVVFMITAPLLSVGVPVDLPRTQAGALAGDDEPLSVTMDAEGLVWVQETQVELDQLIPLLLAVSKRNPDVRIFVRGDQSVSYGQVLEVVGAINAAGFSKVALVTRPPAQDGGRVK